VPQKGCELHAVRASEMGIKACYCPQTFFWMKIQLYNSYDVSSFDPKKAQEMPLAIVAWHWRVASRWSGDDPGAGKLVATDWIGTRLL